MTYMRKNPIISDSPIVYDGDRDPSEVICTITWKLDDLLDEMANQGIPLTDDNIERIESNRLARTLQERSTEEGWEILSDIVSSAAD